VRIRDGRKPPGVVFFIDPVRSRDDRGARLSSARSTRDAAVSTLIGEVPGCVGNLPAHALLVMPDRPETLLCLVLRSAAGHWYKGDTAAPALA
jgi:hypothetical protein